MWEGRNRPRRRRGAAAARLVEPGGGRFTYVYDVAGRLGRLSNPQGERTTFGHDAVGRELRTLLANGTRVSYTYDGAGHLKRLANLGPAGATLSSFDYAYDSVGNRQRVIEATGDRVTWTYDNLYQLTRELRSGSNSYAITYTYDPVGNRLTMRNGGVPTTYAYNAADQLIRSQDAGGLTTYTYDGSGNLATSRPSSGVRTTYSWDMENRLTLVRLPSGTVNTFSYSGDGQRVQKVDSTGTTNFLWDGQNVLLEANAGNVIQVVYTLEPKAYGELVSQRRGGTTGFFHYDALGSTRQLTGGVGTTTDSYLYDAWGNLLTSSGTTTNWLRYVGQAGYYLDSDAGNYYLRSRYYSPELGRFLSRDPIGEGYSANVGLYGYCYNDPCNNYDPSGLQPKTAVTVQVKPIIPCAGKYNIEGFGCGGFEYGVKFITNKPSSGTIVQNVNVTWDVTDCKGKKVPNPFIVTSWFEGWPVSDIGVITPKLYTPGKNDFWHDTYWFCGTAEKTRGTLTITGQVGFIPSKISKDNGWDEIGIIPGVSKPGQLYIDTLAEINKNGPCSPMAMQLIGKCGGPWGFLAHRETPPPGWNDAKKTPHTLTSKWDCCCKTQTVSCDPS